MKIAIIGTGGVGGYFGAKLANAGYNVTFLARGEHLKAMQRDGLLVKSILGDFHLPEVRATDQISKIENPDLLIIAVKAWQVKELGEEIKARLNTGTIVLPLQNGILAAEELMQSVNKSNIIGGLCRIISKIEAPGIINHFGITPTIVFGEIDGSVSNRLKELKGIFDNAGIASKLTDDITAELWKKFIGICVSGLLAVTRTTYGELREIKETRDMMIGLLREVFLVSKKAGVNIEADFVEKSVSFIDTFPYDSTSSLARDVWEGKPSEIEYQNGTVVRLAERYNVDVPINRFIYHCILPMELKARGVESKSN